jgi:hypothetical protein
MKIFQNPFVVGGLALVAVAMVSRNAIGPMWKRTFPPKQVAARQVSNSNAPIAPVATPLQTPGRTLDQTKLSAPELPVNAAEIESRLARWMNAPKRDPFQVTVGELAPPRAEEVLSLSAVWRQSGSRLAVINEKVFTEGEAILGFTIETIGADHIWVQGPRGAENLRFKSAVASGNQTAAARK